MTEWERPNFAEQIERVADGEILGVCVSENKRDWSAEELRPVLTWAEARPTLDYTYDNGYGLVECHYIVAWTKDKVIFVGEYDGSSYITAMPRNPVPCAPTGVGGG